MEYRTENGRTTIDLVGRITADNAGDFEDEISAILAQTGARALELSAAALDYISSAGLRVVMRLLKQLGEVTITDANNEVYDVFEMTGLTEIMSVRRKPRQMSVDGLEQIGEGATAKVYRLDRETIVKVFNPNVQKPMIEREIACSRAAFISGVPTAIPYETVRVGQCWGTVFELLDAEDFSKVLANDREHLVEHIEAFAREIHSLHQIEVDPTRFNDVKGSMMTNLPLLARAGFTEEELGKLRKIFESVPDRSTFVHGDCHPGNVMVQNGEFVFVDLSSCGMGHPIFDMVSMVSLFRVASTSETRRMGHPATRSLTAEECGLVWSTYLKAYLGTDDQETLSSAERQIVAFSSARSLFATVFLPGVFTEESIRQLKRAAFDYADAGVEPIAF